MLGLFKSPGSRVSQDSVEGMVVGFWVFYGSITRAGPVLWFTLDCTFPILTCNQPSYNRVVCIAPVMVEWILTSRDLTFEF